MAHRSRMTLAGCCLRSFACRAGVWAISTVAQSEGTEKNTDQDTGTRLRNGDHRKVAVMVEDGPDAAARRIHAVVPKDGVPVVGSIDEPRVADSIIAKDSVDPQTMAVEPAQQAVAVHAGRGELQDENVRAGAVEGVNIAQPERIIERRRAFLKSVFKGGAAARGSGEDFRCGIPACLEIAEGFEFKASPAAVSFRRTPPSR